MPARKTLQMETQQNNDRPSIADAIEVLIAKDRETRFPVVSKPLTEVPQVIGALGAPGSLITAIPKTVPDTAGAAQSPSGTVTVTLCVEGVLHNFELFGTDLGPV